MGEIKRKKSDEQSAMVERVRRRAERWHEKWVTLGAARRRPCSVLGASERYLRLQMGLPLLGSELRSCVASVLCSVLPATVPNLGPMKLPVFFQPGRVLRACSASSTGRPRIGLPRGLVH